MNLFVMPSRYENFSNAILEAMACGVPFLASDVGGNRIIAEEKAGWLFESGSVASLTAHLQSLLKNRSEMKARGDIGCCYVQKRYTWAASAERLEEIMLSYHGVGK
jgi:glycosyltransferase involved in cell wall biosynthesis